MSGSGISWTICKSAPRSRQITTLAPHHSVFYRPDALPAAQPTASKHWRPDKTSVWYKWSLVSSVRRLSLHIRFRDAMTAKARPIRRVRSGRHWPSDPQCIHSSNLVLIIWHLSRKIQERRQCRQHCWGELQRLLPYSNVLAAISKGTWAIKLCINKILQFLTGRAG